MRRASLTAATLALLALTAAPAQARPLQLGFSGTVSADFGAAASVGANVVRVSLTWSSIAGARPSDPADPGDPAYRWSAADSAIRAASGDGLQVLLMVSGAPTWAQGAHRPASATPGTWKPDPAAFESFATALAKRYSGHYPDPSTLVALPRVRFWQGWNEPNLDVHLAPQWSRRGSRLVAAAPGIYRRLADAFYSAVKRVDPSNHVVLAGLGPYGDPYKGGHRIMPVRFDRSLFCLAPSGRQTCHHVTRFDILDHHPYGVRGPFTHALNRDDAAIPDLGKLQRVVRQGVHRGTVVPRRVKRTWVTEFSWDSSPPDPDGVPVRRQAHWLAESLYVFWKAHVDTALWYQLRDQAPDPGYDSTYQSGVLFLNGKRKPATRAFRFPFVARTRGLDRLLLWGRAPASGRVVIERLTAHGWRPVTARRARAGHVFTASIGGRAGTTFRARDGITSLAAKAR